MKRNMAVTVTLRHVTRNVTETLQRLKDVLFRRFKTAIVLSLQGERAGLMLRFMSRLLAATHSNPLIMLNSRLQHVAT